jgi:hypothetical protein
MGKPEGRPTLPNMKQVTEPLCLSFPIVKWRQIGI